MTDASLPLRDRMEAFAVSLAQGRTQGQAYADAIPKGEAHSLDPTVLRVSGHRWASRSDVKMRVAWLRKQESGETNSIPDVLTSADVIELSLEVSTLLQECYAVSKTFGIVSQSKMEAMRKTLASHLSRQHALSPDDEKPATTDNAEMTTLLNNIHDFGGCTCRI